MFIVWYTMHGIPGYGMKFNDENEARWFADWMSKCPKIYSDISIEKR